MHAVVARINEWHKKERLFAEGIASSVAKFASQGSSPPSIMPPAGLDVDVELLPLLVDVEVDDGEEEEFLDDFMLFLVIGKRSVIDYAFVLRDREIKNEMEGGKNDFN